MKKLIAIMVVAIMVPILVASPAFAKAQKADLNQIGSDPGSGFVVFNDTSGPNNVQLQMSLKGALPDTVYDVIVHMNGSDTPVGTITTNSAGNANFHLSWSEDSPGVRRMGLGLKRSGVWQFGTGGVPHTFK